MTFCLGIKVDEGLVGIADTRVTSGTARITARKVTIHQHGKHSIFLMTSGLRSVRDMALTYFEKVLEDEAESFDHVYELVNAVARQIRRVADEHQAVLERSGLCFNLHALVGGQLSGDAEHKLYMVYPQGNWVEVGKGTPYYIIGESGYGRPILERSLMHDSSLETSLKVGFLAFDATITCAVDVDYPLDVVLYRKDTFEIVEARFERSTFAGVAEDWQRRIRQAVKEMDAGWATDLLGRVHS